MKCINNLPISILIGFLSISQASVCQGNSVDSTEYIEHHDTIVATSCSYVLGNITYFDDVNISDTTVLEDGLDSISHINLTFDVPALVQPYKDVAFDKIRMGTLIKSPEAVFPIDFDEDNDVDIIAFSKNDKLVLLKNTGDLHYNPKAIETSFNNIIEIKAFDYDTDGDIDIVVKHNSNKFGLIRNDQCQFTDHTLSNYYPDLSPNTHYVDLDLDGDLDKVSDKYSYQNNTYSLRIEYFENNSVISDTLIFLEVNGPYSFGVLSSIKVADFNGDSLPDIIYSKHNSFVSGIFYLENKSSFFTSETLFSRWSASQYGYFAKDFQITDLDSDGDLDILYPVTSDNGNVKYQLRYAENDGLGNFETFHISNSGGVNFMIPKGSNQFASHFGPSSDNTGYQNEYDISVNNGGVKLISKDITVNSNAIGAIPKRQNSHTLKIDFDNDNDEDFFLITPENKFVGYYENINDTNYILNTSYNQYLGDKPYKLSDVDGDGSLDILFNNGLQWRQNIGSTYGSLTDLFSYPSSINYWDKELLDLDLDGDLDLIVQYKGYYGQTKDSVLLYKNTENNQLVFENKIEGVYNRVIDFDQDGDLDIVLNNKWLENTGDFGFSNITYQSPISNPKVILDYNNDGKLDLLCKYGDTISWFINDGNLSFSNQHIIDTDAGSYLSDLKVFDYENDGDLDILSIKSELPNNPRDVANLYINKLHSQDSITNGSQTPDLSCIEQSSEDSVFINGDRVLINSTISNLDGRLNDIFQIKYYLSVDDSLSENDILVGTQNSIPMILDSGFSIKQKLFFDIPDSVYGFWNLITVLDDNNVIEEVNENNNTNILSLYIKTLDEVFEEHSEFGSITKKAKNRNQWHTLDFAKTFKNPIIIFGGLTFNNSDAVAGVRIKNLNSNSCKFKIDEWKYLNGKHALETLTYMVIDSGSYILSNGKSVLAGKTVSDHTYRSVNQNPNDNLIFSQTLTNNGASPVTTRVKIDSTFFQIKVQEEENLLTSGHALEDLGFVMIEKGATGLFNGYSLSTTQFLGKQNWKTLPSIDASNNKMILSGLSSTNGEDPATLRYRIKNNTYQFKVQEEKSKNNETKHTYEDISILVITNLNSNSKLDQGLDNNQSQEINEELDQFTLFPNPTNGLVNIQSLNGVKSFGIRVVNNLGQTILEQNTKESENSIIDLNKFQHGLYHIIIESDSDIHTYKVIKN